MESIRLTEMGLRSLVRLSHRDRIPRLRELEEKVVRIFLMTQKLRQIRKLASIPSRGPGLLLPRSSSTRIYMLPEAISLVKHYNNMRRSRTNYQPFIYT